MKGIRATASEESKAAAGANSGGASMASAAACNLRRLNSVAAAAALGVLVLLCGSLDAAPAGPSLYKFYFHDKIYNTTLNNTDFTSVYSAPPPGSFANPFSFGVLSTFEVPLTKSRSNASRQVGVGNGFWAIDGLTGFKLFHIFTATIADGKRNGTLTIMGQIDESLPVRTLTVVGGTGDFLLARGFATSRLVELVSVPPARWVLSFRLRLYY